MVQIEIKCDAMERHPVEGGVLQGSPVSPNLFAIYTSGLIKLVEEYLSAKGLSFVNDLGWVATGSNVNQVVTNRGRCAVKSIEVASRRTRQFHPAKTDDALFSCRRGHMKHLRSKLTANIMVRDVFIHFNRHATRWLGVWMDTHRTLKEHHHRCMMKARAAEVGL